MEALASATGIPEPTLRLLTSVLAAYPIALVQRQLLTPTVSPATRNLFNVVTGAGVALFFCGRDIVHSWITISATWLICRFAQQFLHPKQWWFAQAFSFVFNCAYLLISYYFTASEEYDINWTTPQSVLTLRLIGFAFDFADGAKLKLTAEKKKKEDGDSGTEQSADQTTAVAAPAVAAAAAAATPALARRVETESNRAPTAWAGDLAMPTLPSYLETLGFAYYSGSFLVGPQFSFHLYRRYLTLDLFQSHVPVGTSTRVPINLPLPAVLASGAGYALSTFGLAIVYLAVTQVLSMFFWSGATQLSGFLDASLAYRVAFGWMAGKTALTKYVGMWLLTEGACVVSGMAFDGMDAAGKARWGGLANINVKGFELATSLAQIIASFNINTNHWARLYLFKRLRFLGNKHLSSVGTLTFLAIWHGFHPGYAFAFALEFIDMIVERRLKQSCAGIVNALSVTAVGRALVNVTCWLLTTTALYYAALGFDLLTGKAIITAFNALYWYNHIALPLLFVVTMMFPGRRPASGPAVVKKVQ